MVAPIVFYFLTETCVKLAHIQRQFAAISQKSLFQQLSGIFGLQTLVYTHRSFFVAIATCQGLEYTLL